MTRNVAASLLPYMSHNRCASIAAGTSSYNGAEPGYLPPADEMHFVLHVWTGPNHTIVDEEILELQPSWAHIIQPGVYARFDQDAAYPDQVRLQLWGVVDGIDLRHSLGTAQAWFHLGQQLISCLIGAQIQRPNGSLRPPHVAHLQPCWRPNLVVLHEEAHRAVLAAMQSTDYATFLIPDNWNVAADPTGPATHLG